MNEYVSRADLEKFLRTQGENLTETEEALAAVIIAFMDERPNHPFEYFSHLLSYAETVVRNEYIDLPDITTQFELAYPETDSILKNIGVTFSPVISEERNEFAARLERTDTQQILCRLTENQARILVILLRDGKASIEQLGEILKPGAKPGTQKNSATSQTKTLRQEMLTASHPMLAACFYTDHIKGELFWENPLLPSREKVTQSLAEVSNARVRTDALKIFDFLSKKAEYATENFKVHVSGNLKTISISLTSNPQKIIHLTPETTLFVLREAVSTSKNTDQLTETTNLVLQRNQKLSGDNTESRTRARRAREILGEKKVSLFNTSNSVWWSEIADLLKAELNKNSEEN